MDFELRVNDHPVTRVSAIRKGRATAPTSNESQTAPTFDIDDPDPWFVYEWNAWRVSPDDGRIRHYAAGELVHRYADGIERLAILILDEYRQVARPEQDVPMEPRPR
jgi:hypothetical protein